MKFLIVLCLVVSAFAFPRAGRDPRIAFVEELRTKDSRIIDGQPAQAGQFPFQAFLFTSADAGSRFICGGSLISPSWVITAGHCLYELTQAEVRLGSVDYTTAPVVITSRNLRVYSVYNPSNLNNDIGLVGLGQDVPLSADIQPLRIIPNFDTYEDREATVSGFGATVDGGTVSQTLNWVNVRIISRAECARTYGNDVVISSTLCSVGAQNSSQGGCNGDSGGPLTVDGDVLIGIVSFGSSAGCASAAPNGFVRPDRYSWWITQVTGIEFPDPSRRDL